MLNFYHSSHDSIKSIFHVVKLVCLSLCVLNYTNFVLYFDEASKSFVHYFQRMNQRVLGYKNLSNTARLREYLASKGGYLATTDFLANRMAELRGSGPVSVTRPV